jgi:hypothetical protein
MTPEQKQKEITRIVTGLLSRNPEDKRDAIVEVVERLFYLDWRIGETESSIEDIKGDINSIMRER